MGMLPSASLAGAPAPGERRRGLYEPIHGSAPDIAGLDRANPLAAILSAAMLCRYSLAAPEAAEAIERAVAAVVAAGHRTADLGRLQKSLNALTPDDVAVREIAVVDDAFDPRRDARSRVYEYRILNAPAPSPFWRRHAWHVPELLDARAMDEAAAELVGEHDFAAFRGADAEPVHSTVRRVLESRVDGRPVLVYRIEATAFLKHMVRNIVGTLVEVGRGER